MKTKYLRLLKKVLLNTLEENGQNLQRIMEGKTTHPGSYTMVGWKRLCNVEDCLNDVIENDIEGDIIETGVWKGGVTIFIKALLDADGITDKKVWVADSFEGCPIPELSQDKGFDLYKRKDYAISLESVRENFVKFSLLDEQVCFLKGWFRDTLPGIKAKKFCLIRLDGDLYESTMNGLDYLYPKLANGGWIIVDDYNCYDPCRKAVDHYRKKHQIKNPIVTIDWTGICWKK